MLSFQMDIQPGTSKRALTDDPDSSAHAKKRRTDYDDGSPDTVSPDSTDTSGDDPSTTEECSQPSSTTTASNTNDFPEDSEPGILKLSDDVLLILLSFLKASDLCSLSRCNRRLFNICADKTLWYRVNAVSDGKYPSYTPILAYVHESTTSLEFRKIKCDVSDEDTCFGDGFFKRLYDLKKLKILAVENHHLDAQQLTLKYLPENITELRLSGTQLSNYIGGRDIGFFKNVDVILPGLEVVDVSYCQWFEPHSLVSLAKCTRLKTLKMIGCRNLRDFIPYASVGALFGFRNLETVDMRLTDVVDREIGCFSKVKSLKHIYLERPEQRLQVLNHDANDGDDSITDICTTSLGMRHYFNESNGNQVMMCPIPSDGGNFPDHTVETLVVRNYPKITDLTLKHAEKCLKSLKYLDVTGSSCSEAQVAIFRTNRPDVKLLYNGVVV